MYIIFSRSSDTFEYTAILGRQLELTSSQPSVRVDLEILDDNVPEILLKRFQANLELSWPILVPRPDAITIAPNVANVTIRDDDGETVAKTMLVFTIIMQFNIAHLYSCVFHIP